jgi:hypothetical protein
LARRRTETWTPYGLEAIRVAHIRRRRILALFLAFALAFVWILILQTMPTTERFIEITDGTGSRIEIDTSATDRKDGPLTVAISPGRITRAETGGSQAAGDVPVTRFAGPTYDRGTPVLWGGYAVVYGPFALLAGALWLLARRRPREEINYGIYKGAMPLEMITASAARHVLTTREARRSLFGKRRADYLPHELVVVERMPAEEDA